MYKLIIGFILSILLVSCGGKSGGGEDDPSPKPIDLNKPTVGLDIFALNHRKFPVQDAIDLLKTADQPAFGILYGMFGNDPTNYYQVVGALQDAGKNPIVKIHALCGPCRKPRRDGRFETFFPELTIRELNDALKYDRRGVREAYRNLLIDIKNNFVLPFPTAEFDIVPELESNLDNDALAVSIAIISEVFSGLDNVSLLLNPLRPTRYLDYRFELHSTDINQLPLLIFGDTLSFDGAPFRLDDSSGSGPSFEGTKVLIREALNKGVTVYLWREEWQGLGRYNVISGVMPDDREYTFLNKNRVAELIALANSEPNDVPYPEQPREPEDLPQPSCSAFPANYIYKTIGSTHFTDVRRNTIGLIVRRGAAGRFPDCVVAKDLRGNELARLGAFYPAGDEWAARYYAGIGCGVGTPLNGVAVGKQAEQNTGSTSIILDFGDRCIGPIDATKCINSSQC